MANFGATGVAGTVALSEPAARRPPVIMVHGAFVGGWCFEDFRRPFEQAGYGVSAPDLPGHAAGESGGGVVGKSMRDYAGAVAAAIRAAPEPPILIGHSMGGLVCQLAAQQAQVAALVLLAPSPPWGQPISTPVEGAAAIGLYARGLYWLEAIAPDWTVVRSFTLDRLPEAQARAIYRRMAPESGRALFEVLNWWLDAGMSTLVTAAGVRAPVLAITGDHDQIHSPATVKMAVARLGGVYREAPGLSHWTMGEPGSRAVADMVLDWLEQVDAGRERAAALT